MSYIIYMYIYIQYIYIYISIYICIHMSISISISISISTYIYITRLLPSSGWNSRFFGETLEVSTCSEAVVSEATVTAYWWTAATYSTNLDTL